MKPFYSWILLLFLLEMGAQSVFSQEITIVTSSKIPAFQEAVRGFQATVSPTASVTQYVVPRERDFEGERALGRKIRASNTQLVYAVGLKATLLAKVEIMDVPVVFSSVFYPERYDLPSNMYGVAMNVSVEEQFKTFRTLLPKLQHLGVIYDHKNMDKVIAYASQVASKQQFHLHPTPIEHVREVPTALRTLLPKIDAFWLLPDPVVTNSDSLSFILETVMDHNVPLLGFSPGLVRHGALASISGDARKIGRQAGQQALLLLRGQRVSSGWNIIAAAQPNIALNLNTAELLGVTPPPPLLKLADALFGGPSAFAQHRPSSNSPLSTDSNQTMAIP